MFNHISMIKPLSYFYRAERILIIGIIMIASLAGAQLGDYIVGADAPYQTQDMQILQLLQDLDLNPDTPVSFASLNNWVFFIMLKQNGQFHLRRSDGTPDASVCIKMFTTGQPQELILFNGAMYFTADDGLGQGMEIWKSDGTANGTTLLKDINPGTASSYPEDYCIVGNTLFFTADDGNGRQLWKTNGTTNGTSKAGAIPALSNSPDPLITSLTPAGSQLFFIANEGQNSRELWKWTSSGGTALIKDLDGTADNLWWGGRVFKLDGLNDFAQTYNENAINLANKSFSWEFWAYRENKVQSYILFQGTLASANNYFEAGFLDNDTFIFSLGDNGLTFDSSAGWMDGWNHWAGTFDANTKERKLFHNGIFVAGDNLTNNYVGSGDLFIGYRTDNLFFQGRIDEVRFWNVARTNQQILDNYKKRATLPDATLLGYWRFDRLENLSVNNDGRDDIKDLSATGAHLDLSGGATIQELIPLSIIDNILYFAMDDINNGIVPWKSDGTDAGTIPIIKEGEQKSVTSPKLIAGAMQSSDANKGRLFSSIAGMSMDFESQDASASNMKITSSIVAGYDGYVYVNQSNADGSGRVVNRYDPDTGAFANTFITAPASGNAGWFGDGGIAFGAGNNLFISAQNNIIQYDSQGHYVNQYATLSGSNFSGLAFSLIDGSLYACDTILKRVQNFDGTSWQNEKSFAVPDSWKNQDIGAANLPGSVQYPGNHVILNSSGIDIYDSADAFQFFYTGMDGDGEMIVRVNDITASQNWAKAGIMMRESLYPNSRNVMLLAAKGGYVSMQYRYNNGGSSNQNYDSGKDLPQWLKLTRSGTYFTGKYSADGINWSTGWKYSVPINTRMYVGLALCSHNPQGNEIASADFSNLSFKGNIFLPNLIPTDVASTTEGQIYAAGYETAGVRFDGINDYISVPANPQLIINGPLTVEMWIKLNHVATEQRLLHEGSHLYGLQIQQDGKIQIFHNNGTSDVVYTFNTQIIPNQWTHLAITRQISTQTYTIFINGYQKETWKYTGSVATSGQGTLCIGTREDHNGYFLNGTLREVRIWNWVRTQNDFCSDMNMPLSGTESHLMGYWPMNEGKGTTLKDITAAPTTDGTLKNGAKWAFRGGVAAFNPTTGYITPFFNDDLQKPTGIAIDGDSNEIIITDSIRGVLLYDLRDGSKKGVQNLLYNNAMLADVPSKGFAHNDQSVLIPQISDAELTFEGWFYFHDYSVGNLFHWWTFRYYNPTNNPFQSSYSSWSQVEAFVRTDGKIQYASSNSNNPINDPPSTPEVLVSNESIPLKQWVHLAFTYSNSQKSMAIYKNGNLWCQFQIIYGILHALPTQHFSIGGGYHFDGLGAYNFKNPLNGMVDEFRYWNTILSADQINAAASGLIAAPQNNLRSYWRFDKMEGLGIGGDGNDDIRDLSGNGFHLDLSGSANIVSPSDVMGLPVYLPADITLIHVSQMPFFPEEFIGLGGKVYFSASDYYNGRELWRALPQFPYYDTAVMLNINEGNKSSAPRELTLLNSMFAFSAEDSNLGRELWCSDGTPEGTLILNDMNQGSAGSDPHGLLALNNQIYFSANDGVRGMEANITDGTHIGTLAFGDIQIGAIGSFPMDFAFVRGQPWFTADDGVHGREVWTGAFQKICKLGLNDFPSVRIFSPDAGNHAGHSVSGVGDLNGDSFEDFAIGAPKASPLGREKAGLVYVIMGKSGGPNKDANGNLDLANAIVIYGAGEDYETGISVSGAGDFNGDGFADILIGASQGEGTVMGNDHGLVYLIFGSANFCSMANLDLASFNSSKGIIIRGFPNDFNFTGCSVSSVGNINDDFNSNTGLGLDDIIIGAWGAGDNRSGQAYLVYGRTQSLASIELKSMSQGEGMLIKGIDINHQNLGSSVSGVGDVNGDGYADILIASDGHISQDPDFDAPIYLIYGPQSFQKDSKENPLEFPLELDLSAPVPPAGVSWIKLTGVKANPVIDEHSGTSISGLGDINMDGYADFIIGAPGTDYNGATNIGEAYIVFGSSKPIGINGELDLTQIDTIVDSNRDGNRDGYIIRAFYSKTKVGFDFNNAYLGYSVSSAGDLNGDGYFDILVGAPGLDTQQIGKTSLGFTNAGAVFIIYGQVEPLSDNGIINVMEADTKEVTGIVGNIKNGALGWCVSMAGDVNGDGMKDWLAGSPSAFDTDLTGQAFLINGIASEISRSANWNSIRTGMDGINNIDNATEGVGMSGEGSHTIPLSHVSFRFKGGKGPSQNNPCSRQVARYYRYPIPQPNDVNWKPAPTFWYVYTNRENSAITKAKSILTFHYLESDVAGMDMNKTVMCMTYDDPLTENSCWFALRSTFDYNKRTITVEREHDAGKMRFGITGIYCLFEINDSYELGQNIPIPCIVDLNNLSPAGPTIENTSPYDDVTIPLSGSQHLPPVLWHLGTKRLYAVAPSHLITLTWKDKNENLICSQIFETKWPSENKFQTYVANTPQIDLTANSYFKSNSLRAYENSLKLDEASIGTQQVFAPQDCHGRCFFMFTTGQNMVQDPIYFLPVRVIFWNEAPYFLDNQPAVIGTEIMDESLHDTSLGSPYVYFWQHAYYNASDGYYVLGENNSGPTREGPVIPINEDLNIRAENHLDDMVLVYYQKTPHLLQAYSQQIVTCEMSWGWIPVRYNCQWPSNPPKIIIASGNGTGDLSAFTRPSIYFQNNSNLPGYNPNEEHALILGSTAYALRCDLNITQTAVGKTKSSLPYTLINYTDLDSGKTKMLVYKVEAEDSAHTFNYTGKVGNLIQSPMPLPILLASANYCPNTGTVDNPTGCYDATNLLFDESERAVVYVDKNFQMWCSAGRKDGADGGKLAMRYFYPNQPGFAYPDWNVAPAIGECTPWLDKYAHAQNADHALKIPVDVVYTINWPEDVPELRMGETLVRPKFGLPDITDQVAVRIIYQQSNLQNPPKTAAELGNATRLVTADLNWTLSDFPADVKWEQVGNKIKFTVLSPLLKPRFWFAPDDKKIKFQGLFIEPAAGESYVLPSIMTDAEYNALKNISPALSTNSNWLAALNTLRQLSQVSVMTIRKGSNLDQFQNLQEFSVYGTFVSGDSQSITIKVNNTNQTYSLSDGAKVLDTNNVITLMSALRPGDAVGLTLATAEIVGSPSSMTKALASTGKAESYITIAFNDHPDAGTLPVSLAVISIKCGLYQGEIKEIEPTCVFDEQLTLRHSGDLNGKSGDYLYEWRTLPDPGTGNPPETPFDEWDTWGSGPAAGAIDITIKGAGLFTLSDNWFIMRYKKDPAKTAADDPACVKQFSDWTAPMLAPGWIKRVMGRIDPFQQRAVGGGLQTAEDRFLQYQNLTINSIISMIAEAGKRYEGDVALNCEAIDNFGLIEIYETVLRRGISFSIDGTPPVDYAPANHALVLCAGRISDLYMLLGNEAFADALDPTIAIGTDSPEFGAAVTSIYCFMDQTSSLLEEELALLRGRSAQPKFINQVQNVPIYNRLYWNFTQDIVGGQVAYALNYDIRDESGNVDGIINAEDAAVLYPQGHGDAWGHYLKASKIYYELLRHPRYTWTPHAEAVIVGGEPVAVNYMHERKFASVAQSKAKAGAEIVEQVYRNEYSGDPDEQWKGYKDEDPDRAWGVYEWAVRAGQGAYFDWVVANAVIPAKDTVNEGIQKVDRSTVLDLSEIPAAFDEIQSKVNNADACLNPLGLASNVIPFDIESTMLDPVPNFPLHSHFDQIYERAIAALQNAVSAFDYANNATQALRKQSDAVADFQQMIRDQEFDFNCRLIEIFGQPYPEDMGPGKLYAGDYTGPDFIHFMYVDVPQLSGDTTSIPTELRKANINFAINDVKKDGSVGTSNITVTYHFNPDDFTFTKPRDYSRRAAQGEIQFAIGDIIRARYNLDAAVEEYWRLGNEIQDMASLIKARNDTDNDIILLHNNIKTSRAIMGTLAFLMKSYGIWAKHHATMARQLFNSTDAWIPDSEIVGLADGGDIFAPVEGAEETASYIVTQGLSITEVIFEIASDAVSFIEENAIESNKLEIEQDELTYTLEKEMVHQLKQLIRSETTKRREIIALVTELQQCAARYESAMAKGYRLLEERNRFRQKTAAQVNMYRYKDMAFRIFRNDAVQKFRAQLDLAAMFAYLAAQVYDYETCFQPGDSRGPGSDFMTGIVKTRSVGIMKDGNPQTAGVSGDPGIADYLARLNGNWSVIKPQLGINNPQQETNQISLRSELFRKVTDEQWRNILNTKYVADLKNDPEFNRLCIPPQGYEPDGTYSNEPEPAFVFSFPTSVVHGENYFGFELGAGDSAYDSTKYATKIRTAGVWFSNYKNLGLSNTPRVYLVPAGTDIMRTPTFGAGEFRFFSVVDQAIPAPFRLSPAQLQNNPTYIPIQNSLSGTYAAIRKYGMMRAYNDDGLNFDQTTGDNRLVCRSIWNTKWLLIIPLRTMGNDPEYVKERFINGVNNAGGVSDIKLIFYTYAYSGIGGRRNEDAVEKSKEEVAKP